jgi:hypothetical protein
MKTSLRIAGVLAEIRSRHLMNTSLKKGLNIFYVTSLKHYHLS